MNRAKLTDTNKFSKVARYAFAPIYPFLANQIKAKFGIENGVCIDVGSGPGNLAIEMAKITNLKVFSLDLQPQMSDIALENIKQAGLSNRITTITADVCHIPFPDDSVDLVISRGSIFFWEDRPAGCAEIYRILKPGGVAYCGGGMGTPEIRAQVMQSIEKDDRFAQERDFWVYNIGKNRNRLEPEELCARLMQMGIPATAEKENDGIWIQFIK
jgi:ubiquinone/menaquinone biosynthesis C-methylase UbiE